jgi:vancomycin resistance protein YoaR
VIVIGPILAAALAGVCAGAATDAREPTVLRVVSTFTTSFTPGEARNINIVLVARRVDGAVIKPGETFSLNDYTGPRGYAEGYVDAPVILYGRLVNAVGGGISQFTTTLFNAVYYAGLEDVFHKPHSYYISRYPPVVESTIYYPTLDLRFRNDTDHGILVDTSTTNHSVTVTLWGAKEYDVSTKWGPKRDISHPRTVRVAARGCVPSAGSDGFVQDAWRIFKRHGVEVRRERFSWRYRAEPRFICARP